MENGEDVITIFEPKTVFNLVDGDKKHRHASHDNGLIRKAPENGSVEGTNIGLNFTSNVIADGDNPKAIPGGKEHSTFTAKGPERVTNAFEGAIDDSRPAVGGGVLLPIAKANPVEGDPARAKVFVDRNVKSLEHAVGIMEAIAIAIFFVILSERMTTAEAIYGANLVID